MHGITPSRGDLGLKVIRGKPASDTSKRWWLRVFALFFNRYRRSP